MCYCVTTSTSHWRVVVTPAGGNPAAIVFELLRSSQTANNERWNIGADTVMSLFEIARKCSRSREKKERKAKKVSKTSSYSSRSIFSSILTIDLIEVLMIACRVQPPFILCCLVELLS